MEAGNVIETHEHTGEFKGWWACTKSICAQWNGTSVMAINCRSLRLHSVRRRKRKSFVTG